MDTETDGGLYSAAEGAAAVDAMCDTAFALLSETAFSGGSFMFGFTGSEITSGVSENIPALLAYPARTALGGGARLPCIPEFSGEGGVLIMSLARRPEQENTALQNFTAKRRGSHAIQILFFYGNEKQKNFAEASAILYNRMVGVSASVEKLVIKI
jgi:hypothetical protein